MAGNRQPSVLLLGSEMAARAAAAAAGGPTSNSLQHAMAASSALAGSPYYPAPGAGVQLARYPEVGLFSQFGQLFPKSSAAAAPSLTPGSEAAPAGGRGKSADSKSSYASRHQAAEQRRRTRINERLDRLRNIVPHAERANTAAFLEEVINYIVSLQQRVVELEEAAEEAEKAAEEQERPAKGGKGKAGRAARDGKGSQQKDDGKKRKAAADDGAAPSKRSNN